MRRYLQEAAPLARQALIAALDQAGLHADQIGMLVVASCTGYATPGLDVLLARDLGMAPETQRLVLGHMGCAAALPGLGAVADYVTARNRPAVLVCVELTTLHVQPSPDSRGPLSPAELEQVVTHSLFGDAAAAVVALPAGTAPGPPPSAPAQFAVVEVTARTDVTSSADMTWDVTDFGFRMSLSARVPTVLARHVHPMVTDLLGRHGLNLHDIGGWVVHPGGPRILHVIAERLALDEEALICAWEVLRDYGNCSSTTVLLELEQLRATHTIGRGTHVVVLAFGPGLTLYAALLTAT